MSENFMGLAKLEHSKKRPRGIGWREKTGFLFVYVFSCVIFHMQLILKYEIMHEPYF